MKMRDNYGDRLTVDGGPGEVYLEVEDNVATPSAMAIAALSPKKARRLAKALRRAAKKAEAL